MIKKLFKKIRSEDIVRNYQSYSDYAHRASDNEKKMVIERAISEANDVQKNLVTTP